MKIVTCRYAYLFITDNTQFLAYRKRDGLFWGYLDGKLTAMALPDWEFIACERMGVGMVMKMGPHIPRKLTIEDQRATDWMFWPNPVWCANEAIRTQPWYIKVLNWIVRKLNPADK